MSLSRRVRITYILLDLEYFKIGTLLGSSLTNWSHFHTMQNS